MVNREEGGGDERMLQFVIEKYGCLSIIFSSAGRAPVPMVTLWLNVVCRW